MIKRILVITPFFYPHIGGSQYYMECLYASLIKAHPKIKVDVLCYNTDKKPAQEIYRGLNIYRIPSQTILKDQFVLPKLIPLLKFLLKNKYDLIHTSTRFFDSSWWAPVFAKLTGTKVILTDHCATHPEHENPLIRAIAKYIDLTVVNLSLHLFDKVLVTNKAAQDFLSKTFNIKSEVVYGGVDTSIFRPGKKENKRLKIVFVGRMIKSKGARMLFDTIKVDPIVQQLSEVSFAGPGPEVKNFKFQISNFKLNNIKVLGPLKPKGVARLLSQSDIFVHPSYHHEGFPNAIVEAGASKLAVIATDVGGTREIIINNKTGLLIPSKDQKALKETILVLLKDKNLREKLSQNLYNYIRTTFSWEKASQKLYTRILTLS